jgi:hypothetical protein
MNINPGDVLFLRGGKPSVVKNKDETTGNILVDRELDSARTATPFGIKNGLAPEQREAYQTILSDVSDKDKHQEIETLYKQVEQFKKEKKDPRLVKYLENELHFRMVREKYYPQNYTTDPLSLLSY